MAHEIIVEIERIVSDESARAVRAPDAQCPAGRMYGVQLKRVRDAYDRPATVREGTRLRVSLSDDGLERVLSATIADTADVGSHQVVTV